VCVLIASLLSSVWYPGPGQCDTIVQSQWPRKHLAKWHNQEYPETRPTACSGYPSVAPPPSLVARLASGWLSFRFWRSWELYRICKLSSRQLHCIWLVLVTRQSHKQLVISSGFCSDRTKLTTGQVMAGEFWIQLFGSCVAEQEPQPRRPRIDRSQIGQPMNFRHTGHVGSTDLGSISTLQSQMKGKGGEPVHIQVPHIMNARSIHEMRRTSIKAWSWRLFPVTQDVIFLPCQAGTQDLILCDSMPWQCLAMPWLCPGCALAIPWLFPGYACYKLCRQHEKCKVAPTSSNLIHKWRGDQSDQLCHSEFGIVTSFDFMCLIIYLDKSWTRPRIRKLKPKIEH